MFVTKMASNDKVTSYNVVDLKGNLPLQYRATRWIHV
jgi:hypothetical protein